MEYLTKKDINECVKILKNGGILAFPTETVFGLGVISSSEIAFSKLVETKKRPPNKPFTMMCSKLEQVDNYVEINETTKKVVKAFMPGPITIVAKAKENVPSYLDLKSGFIGFRIPDYEFVLKMIDKVGSALLVPSANPSNEAPALTDKEVIKYFDNEIDGVVEGVCDKLSPSTVIKINGNEITILREGPVSKEQIMEAIK